MGVLPTPAMLPGPPVVQTPSQAGSHANHQQQWATSVAQEAQQQMSTANLSLGMAPSPLTVTPAMPAGLFMGDSLAPLPAKLVKKIQVLEFAEMADLLPEAWVLEESVVEAQFRQQKGPVADILAWIQYYSVLVSILSLHYQDKVQELMAYMAAYRGCCTTGPSGGGQR